MKLNASHFEVYFSFFCEIYFAWSIQLFPQTFVSFESQRFQQRHNPDYEVRIFELKKGYFFDDSFVHDHRNFAPQLQRDFIIYFFFSLFAKSVLVTRVLDHFPQPLLQLRWQVRLLGKVINVDQLLSQQLVFSMQVRKHTRQRSDGKAIKSDSKTHSDDGHDHLQSCLRIDVSIAYCGQRGKGPVDAC